MGKMSGFELPPRLCLQDRLEKTERSRQRDGGSGSSRKGQPWSEAEHLSFLHGLKKLGKGNWRGISHYFVPSRTPTQVASHAQKHFLRTNGVCKRKSRFSLLEQAASAQGLLASESQCLPSAPLAIPIFYGMPAFSAGQADRREGHSSSATSSDNSGAEYSRRRQGLCSSSFPESSPAFTKICRPVPYHASARTTDMAKLREDLAAAAADDKLGSQLQPSSRSAFFPVRPSVAISI